MDKGMQNKPELFLKILILAKNKDDLFKMLASEIHLMLDNLGFVQHFENETFKLTDKGHRALKELKRLTRLKKVTE